MYGSVQNVFHNQGCRNWGWRGDMCFPTLITFSHVNMSFFFLMKVRDERVGRSLPIFDFCTVDSINFEVIKAVNFKPSEVL